jgi:hypothetical protein
VGALLTKAVTALVSPSTVSGGGARFGGMVLLVVVVLLMSLNNAARRKTGKIHATVSKTSRFARSIANCGTKNKKKLVAPQHFFFFF